MSYEPPKGEMLLMQIGTMTISYAAWKNTTRYIRQYQTLKKRLVLSEKVDEEDVAPNDSRLTLMRKMLHQMIAG